MKGRYFDLAMCGGALLALLAGCGGGAPSGPAAEPAGPAVARPEIYADAVLTADLTYLTDNQRRMLVLLIEASRVMDELFWRQSYGDGHSAWLANIADGTLRSYAEQNYGPWDRLDGDRPFIEGTGPKPPGAGFYPPDMSIEEFRTAFLRGKAGQYSLVRRDAGGTLTLIPYHVAYAEELQRVAELLRSAAALAESADFATYLKLRAVALLSDEYQVSDLYWMDVRDNEVDIVIGPVEPYEDKLFGYRAAYESMVLLKDLEWSARLVRYTGMLPDLQAGLPVPGAYKREVPGSDSELNAYDVLYYGGYANVPPVASAADLPNDEAVKVQKGSRRMQFRNSARARFDKILLPLAGHLIDESQLEHVTFEALFDHAMLHEVAHGLGIRQTLDGRATVQEALRDLASMTEEAKADVLGMYMIEQLHSAGEFGDNDIMDYYVTFLAEMLRSARSGGANAHARANMIVLNYLVDRGAIARERLGGRYGVDPARMQAGIADLARRLLMMQGDGDYAAAAAMAASEGASRAPLREDLDRLAGAGIPVEIRFRQGRDVLGLRTE